MNTSPHFSPVRLWSSAICLLSIRYDNLLTISTQQTALDAPSLVFLMRSIPGAPPSGTLRVSKSIPDGFVPPAGTCSLRPSLGATLRAAVAVQIVCPDNLSLNQSYGYAFGRRHPLAVTNLPGADLDARRAPVGGAPGKAHIKNPARSSHHLVRNAG